MHVLFVHRNFPAQFGHVAARLVKQLGWRCSFVSEKPPQTVAGVQNLQYRVEGGATERTHYFSRTFENAVWHAASVYEALRPFRDELRPDLIVGHSGFGSTLYLGELFPDAPVIGYFEFFYRAHGSDLDFRPDMPPSERDVLRTRSRNAMILLDLEYCDAGYSPTEYQAGLLPEAYRPKLEVIHDGIDTSFWRRDSDPERVVGERPLERGERLVTYVSRGLEAMRGFDVFMRVAKRVCEERSDVRFAVVGREEIAYGGDLAHTGGTSFKEHVLAQDDYDLSRFDFLGNIPPSELRRLFSLSDCHVYLTAPFVLSWSLLDAMACGCTVVGSDTAPVREVLADGENGLLSGFFDAQGLAERVLGVLEDPEEHRRGIGAEAARTVTERYALDVTFPRLANFFGQIAASSRKNG